MVWTDYAPILEELPQFFAGLLMLALAALVLRVRFGAPLNRAFALYLVLAGVYNVLGALDDTPTVRVLALRTSPYFSLSVPFALAHLALRYRASEDGAEAPRWAAWALLVAGVAVVGMYGVHHAAYSGWLSVLGLPLAVVVSAGVALAFALRIGRARSAAERDGLVVGAVAFVLSVLHVGASRSVTLVLDGVVGDPISVAGSVLRIAALAVALVAVVRLARADPDRAPRIVGVALLALSTGVADTLLFRAGVAAASNLAQGVWQLALPVLLGWAILRHQLFGLDVKVRWTLSRGTVAAAFIAIFFVASEGAQLLLGQENPYVGLMAAGALVFAIAPLQRAADRLAERAVPVESPAPASTAGAPRDDGGRDAYRVLLRRFVADGRISRDEERALARTAERFGLSHEETVALRHEVEDEIDAGPRG